MSSPSSSTSPASDAEGTSSCMRLSRRRNVDLPQPDGPMRAVTSPAGMARSTPSSTRLSPNQAWASRASRRAAPGGGPPASRTGGRPASGSACSSRRSGGSARRRSRPWPAPPRWRRRAPSVGRRRRLGGGAWRATGEVPDQAPGWPRRGGRQVDVEVASDDRASAAAGRGLGDPGAHERRRANGSSVTWWPPRGGGRALRRRRRASRPLRSRPMNGRGRTATARRA